VNRRQADYDERLIGEVGGTFEYNRGQLLRSVGKNAQDVVQRYDRERESHELALSLQGAVAQTAAFEVGAVGIGAVVAIAPYTRFVRTEHARMTRAASELAAIDAEADTLRAEISATGVGRANSP